MERSNQNDHTQTTGVMENAEKMGQNLRVPVPGADVPGIGRVKSLAFKQLICGTIAGAVASTAVAPFDIVRTRVIAGHGGHSTKEVLKTVLTREGLQSIMKGNLVVSIFLAALGRGIQFVTFEAVKRRQLEKYGKDVKLLPSAPRAMPISTLAGASSGLASTLVMYPFQAMMDRMLLQPKEYKSMAGSMLKVIGNEGIQGLYRGLGASITSAVPSAAASFLTFDTLKKKYLEQSESEDLGIFPSLLIGAVAGIVSSTLTYPLEVVRKQINMSALPNRAVGVGPINYSNTFQAVKGIMQKEGFPGLYRGFNMEASRIIPFTALSFMVYELCKRILVAQNEERRDEVKG